MQDSECACGKHRTEIYWTLGRKRERFTISRLAHAARAERPESSPTMGRNDSPRAAGTFLLAACSRSRYGTAIRRRSNIRSTVFADHAAPRGVGMARIVNSVAIARADRPDMPSRRGRNDSARAAELVLFTRACLGVAQHDAAFTGRCKRLAGTFRNHPSFLLGQRGVNVQHERIRVPAQFGNDERHALRH